MTTRCRYARMALGLSLMIVGFIAVWDGLFAPTPAWVCHHWKITGHYPLVWWTCADGR